MLLFFTGGWAFGDIQHTSTAAGFPVDQFTNHQSGLTAGGGIAYALTNNVIGKIEYRYYDFGRYNRAGNPLTPNGQLPYTVDNTYSVVTLGIDFKFGGPSSRNTEGSPGLISGPSGICSALCGTGPVVRDREQ